MKKFILILCCLFCLTSTGCRDVFYLEDTDIALIIGLDKGEEKGEIVQYSIVPVFDEDVQKKFEIQETRNIKSLREGRKLANAQTTGFLSSRKLQVLLLGKELLKERNLYPFLDPFYRNPKSEVNGQIAVVDGEVAEIVNSNWEEKGQPGVVLSHLLEQGYKNGNTLSSTLFRYKRQMLDHRITPYLTEIKKDQDKIIIVGTTLLKPDGTYQLTLDTDESTFLQLMKSEMETEVPVPIRFTMNNTMREFNANVLDVSHKVKTKLERKQLVINLDLKLTLELYERPFYYPTESPNMKEKFEQKIAEHLKQRFENLIAKLQENQVDPIGLGVYVRAQQYPYWNQLKQDWSQVFSKAKIEVNPQVTIRGSGITM